MHNHSAISQITKAGRTRIHVLGLGSVGCFAAHSLAETPQRPIITLLLHRTDLLQDYISNKKGVSLQNIDKKTIHHSGYNIEFMKNDQWRTLSGKVLEATSDLQADQATPADNHIDNLVVSVKALQTVKALKPIRHRLSKESTILFLQNGCGIIDAVNQDLFPDSRTRPRYIIGVISHGIGTNRPFNVTHTGFSATSLGLVPDSTIDSHGTQIEALENQVQNSRLLSALCSIPRMNAKAYIYTDILQIQLEKLTVNSFCNPICALHDKPNGYLQSMHDMRRELITEISAVIMKLPELQGVPGITERFAFERLDKVVSDIIEKTANTTNSMVWDLRAGRKTEINYINEYWCRKGKEIGVPTPLNDDLVRKIRDREKILLPR